MKEREEQDPRRHQPTCGWGYWDGPKEYCDYPPGHAGPHKGEECKS